MDVFVQQQPVQCQEVYGLQQLVLLLNCLSTRALDTPGCVRLLELLCAPGVSVYQSLCELMCVRLQEILCAPGVSVYKIMCCTYVRVRLQELLCVPGVFVYKSLCFTCM
jgi:hypothetical protein